MDSKHVKGANAPEMDPVAQLIKRFSEMSRSLSGIGSAIEHVKDRLNEMAVLAARVTTSFLVMAGGRTNIMPYDIMHAIAGRYGNSMNQRRRGMYARFSGGDNPFFGYSHAYTHGTVASSSSSSVDPNQDMQKTFNDSAKALEEAATSEKKPTSTTSSITNKPSGPITDPSLSREVASVSRHYENVSAPMLDVFQYKYIGRFNGTQEEDYKKNLKDLQKDPNFVSDITKVQEELGLMGKQFSHLAKLAPAGSSFGENLTGYVENINDFNNKLSAFKSSKKFSLDDLKDLPTQLYIITSAFARLTKTPLPLMDPKIGVNMADPLARSLTSVGYGALNPNIPGLNPGLAPPPLPEAYMSDVRNRARQRRLAGSMGFWGRNFPGWMGIGNRQYARFGGGNPGDNPPGWGGTPFGERPGGGSFSWSKWATELPSKISSSFLASSAFVAGGVRAASPAAFDTLFGSFKLLAIKLSEGLLPSIASLSRGAQDAADWIAKQPQWLKEVGGKLLVFGTAVIGGTLLLTKLGGAIASTIATLRRFALGPGGGAGAFFGRAALGIGGIAGGLGGMFLGHALGQSMGMDAGGFGDMLMSIGGFAGGMYALPKIMRWIGAGGAGGGIGARALGMAGRAGAFALPALAFGQGIAAYNREKDDPVTEYLTSTRSWWNFNRARGVDEQAEKITGKKYDFGFWDTWDTVKKTIQADLPAGVSLRERAIALRLSESDPAEFRKMYQEKQYAVAMGNRLSPMFSSIDDAWKNMALSAMSIDPIEQKILDEQIKNNQEWLRIMKPVFDQIEVNTRVSGKDSAITDGIRVIVGSIPG